MEYLTPMVVVSLGLIVYLCCETLYSKLPFSMSGGATDERFVSVVNAFEQNFMDGWEKDGAALTVYYRGRMVVDVWGGYADTEAARKWEKNTIMVTFGLSQAVAGLCIAVLVDRHLVAYEDPVAKHWPAFASNHKENITVQMVLSHTAGLAYLDEQITEDIAADHNLMRAVLENEEPKWSPGSRMGYHIFTFGWIVDQIVRHCDKKGRGVAQFFNEEIASEYGIDYFFGLPTEEEYRVARLSHPSYSSRISELLQQPLLVKRFFRFFVNFQNSFLSRAIGNPDWLQVFPQLTVNNPDYHRLQEASQLGIGNARSIAQLFNLLATKQLVSAEVLEELKVPIVNDTDIVLNERLARGSGLLFYSFNRGRAQRLLGQSGFGCQQVSYDPYNDVIVAYLTNHLKTGLHLHCRTYARLHSAVYDIVERFH